MSAGADWSRTCKGCRCVETVMWPVKGSYSKETEAYRCNAPGPHQGYHIGTGVFLPYVPAWCPEIQKGTGDYGTKKAYPGSFGLTEAVRNEESKP